ncbi:hypothetical protein YC2023_098069 [Brassica napus]
MKVSRKLIMQSQDASVEDAKARPLQTYLKDLVGRTYTFKLKLFEFKFSSSKHQSLTTARTFDDNERQPMPNFAEHKGTLALELCHSNFTYSHGINAEMIPLPEEVIWQDLQRLSVKASRVFKEVLKCPEVSAKIGSSPGGTYTIWSSLGDGAKLGRAVRTGTDLYGSVRSEVDQEMFRLNNWRRLGVGAKIGRGTDRRSVPSTVLVPDQPEMKLLSLSCKGKAALTMYLAIFVSKVHGSLKGTNQEAALALTIHTVFIRPFSLQFKLSFRP